jgi:hypothetical protein
VGFINNTALHQSSSLISGDRTPDTAEIFSTPRERRGYHLIIYDFRRIHYAIKKRTDVQP